MVTYLVHGNQTLNTVYVTEDRSNEFLTQMAHRLGANSGDVVCFGHTHKPWQRTVDGVHFFNTGSVGRPKDGDWRAGYVLLDVERDAVKAMVIRVAYDLNAAMAGIRASELPDDFADYLQTGGRPVSAPALPSLPGTANAQ